MPTPILPPNPSKPGDRTTPMQFTPLSGPRYRQSTIRKNPSNVNTRSIRRLAAICPENHRPILRNGKFQQKSGKIRQKCSRYQIPNRIHPPKPLRRQPTPSIRHPKMMCQFWKPTNSRLHQQRIQIYAIRHEPHPSLFSPTHSRFQKKPVRTPKVQEIAISINSVKQGRPLSTPTLRTTSETRLPNRIRFPQIGLLQESDRSEMRLRQSDRLRGGSLEGICNHRCYDTSRGPAL